MNRNIPELKEIICTQEYPDNREFICKLKCGLLLALVEMEILDETQYEQAEAALLRKDA